MMELSTDHHIAFWESLGEQIARGTPLIEAVPQAARRADDPQLLQAAGRIERAFLDGMSMSEAMCDEPELFDAAIIAAVAEGERTGELHDVSSRIAQALRAGDVSRLSPQEEGSATDVGRSTFMDLFARAVSNRASDIHIQPVEDGRVLVRFRVDGVLHEVEAFDRARGEAVTGWLERTCHLDPAAELPQDGRLMTDHDGRRYDIRLSTLPTIFGQRMTLRLLQRDEVRMGLDKLTLSDEQIDRVRKIAHSPAGLVVVTGPTGSGKTTTIYSMLLDLDASKVNVMTVEDPVELALPEVSQVAIRPQSGLTFSRVTRQMLRHDPDVMFVGEVRDPEMMMLCVQVALTGHLSVTTLHVADAIETVERMIHLGVQPFLLNSSLRAILSQRLIRRLCNCCREPIDVPAHSLPPLAADVLEGLSDVQFYRANGCSECLHTGYRGRIGVFEILEPTDALREAISAQADTRRLREVARAGGFESMFVDGLKRAAAGQTTLEEVLRVLPPS
jgi:type II secretory ATPase GspE/PulE/Tfp pilus assembly ATPase PilB-like protein